MITLDRIMSSSHLKWYGLRGVAEVSGLQGLGFNPLNGQPITVISERTQAKRVFYVDTSVNGHEDGWDGEVCYYVSSDQIRIVFYND